jgi:hypothetical protein
MLKLDVDPGEEPRPSDEPSEGMETEDELAEDLIPSPRQAHAIWGRTRRAPSSGPEDEDKVGGMETEEETRSPKGRRRDQVFELARR